MDGSRDYHSKWNKSDKEKNIIWYHYIWNLKYDTGNPLAVQGLALWAFTAKDLGSIPAWGTKILQALWGSQKNKKQPIFLNRPNQVFQKEQQDVRTTGTHGLPGKLQEMGLWAGTPLRRPSFPLPSAAPQHLRDHTCTPLSDWRTSPVLPSVNSRALSTAGASDQNKHFLWHFSWSQPPLCVGTDTHTPHATWRLRYSPAGIRGLFHAGFSFSCWFESNKELFR